MFMEPPAGCSWNRWPDAVECAPEFVEAWLAEEKKANESPRPRDAGTVAGLIRSYGGSVSYEKKRDSTKGEYRRILGVLEKRFGTMPVAALQSSRARSIFLDYHEEVGRDRAREADNRLGLLSAVFNHARDRGEIDRNPIEGFKRLYHANRAEIVWTADDIEKFLKDASPELRAAMVLALSTGQRYGDLIRLRWSDYDGDLIRLQQSKGGARVPVSCHADLKAFLDNLPRRGPYILTRPDGRPWFTAKDNKALGKAWRANAEAAAITGLHFHDLRGTAVTVMGEAGLSIPEISLITGHSLQQAAQILSRYMASNRRLSQAAILAWGNASRTAFANQLQTATDGQSEQSKKVEQ